jgi:hypothetical protein
MVDAVFNVAERVGQVRQMKAHIKALNDEFEKKLFPFEEWLEKAEAELLVYLNKSGQKSAATALGTAYWSERVTYRVQDKDEFRRHVIGTEQWELTTFAAAGVACETFTTDHKEPPPGLTRHVEREVHVIAPSKPRLKGPKKKDEAPQVESMTSGQ